MKKEGYKGLIGLIVGVLLIGFYFKDPFSWFHNKTAEPEPTEQETVGKSFQRMSEEEMKQNLKNANVGELITFGVLDNEEYLQWKVLDKEEGKILVILDSLITVKPFNNTTSDENKRIFDITWAMSDLRSWMNNELCSEIFNDFEMGCILDTNVVTPPGTKADFRTGEFRAGGEDCVDKLFCLSYDEVSRYMTYADGRIPPNYIYTISRYENGMLYTDEIIREVPGTEYRPESGVGSSRTNEWWLRTPGNMSSFMQYIDSNGEIDEQGTSADNENVGIRPAMWLNTAY